MDRLNKGLRAAMPAMRANLCADAGYLRMPLVTRAALATPDLRAKRGLRPRPARTQTL